MAQSSCESGMHARFPAIYRDRNGEVSTELVIDGCEMRLVVRGVEFSGLDFDALEPNPESDPTKVAGFTLQQHGYLVSCEIIFTMPLPVVVGDALTTNPLQLRIEVPREEPGVWNWAKAYLALTIGDQTFRSAGHSGHLESEMLDIQQQLPAGTYMKACINCAYSDYSPFGGYMTGMMCFRRNKAAYLAVPDKWDLFRLTDEVQPEYVQEFHLCPEFEGRRPGTGYRG